MARKKSAKGKNAKKKRPGQGNDGAPGTAGATQQLPYHGPKGKGRSSGATGGPVPNLYWGHVSMEELRACPRFVGLAEPSEAPLPCPAAARYVRQGSPAWRQLHTGVLTTGLLKEALGMREPQAARVVGGRKESSHAPLLAAFQHLQQPPQLPPALGPLEEAAWRRQAVEQLVRHQQGNKQQRQQQRQQQQQQQHLQEADEADTDISDVLHDDDDDDDERYRVCAAALSGGGLVGVRCAWGKTQEAAALAQLLDIFPSSTLHEVGLCCVPEGSPAVASRPGLPPLAASPDALIAHHLRLEHHEAGSLLAALREAQAETEAETEARAGAGAEPGLDWPHPRVGCGTATSGQHPQRQDAAQDVRGAGPSLAAAGQRLQLLLRELLLRVPLDRSGGSGEDSDDGDVGGDGSADGDEGDAAGESESRVSGDGEGGEVLGGSLARDGRTELEGEEEEEEGAEEEGSAGSMSDCEDDGDGVGMGAYDTEVGDDGTGEALRAVSAGEPAVARADQRPGGLTPGRGCAAVDPARAASLAAPAAAAAAAAAATAAGAVAASSAAAALAVAAADGWVTTAPTTAATAAVTATASGAAATAAALHGNLLAVVLESALPAVLLCGTCGEQRKPQPLADAAADGGAGRTDGCIGGEATADAAELPYPSLPPPGDAASGASGRLGDDDCKPEHRSAFWCVCSRGSIAARAAAERSSSIRTAPAPAAAAQAPTPASRCDGGADGGGGATRSAAAPDAVHVVLREVVEVKNTCPFGIRQVRRGGKGRLVSELVLSDRGPRRAVSPSWVPQMQLHMLAAGCGSGLLVSRSATKGTSVFRMWRDDDYLARMLGLLERFNSEFVRRRVPPPHDMFARQPDYMAFLGATARLARTAVQLTGDAPWRPRPAGVEGLVQVDGTVVDGAGGVGGGLGRGTLDRDQAFLRRERSR